MKHYEHLGGIMSSILHSRRIAMISGVVLLIFTLTFCGCLSRPPLDEQTFAFTVPLSSTMSRPTSNRVLGVKSLQIAPPFDGRSFVYRTGEFSYERDPYAGFLGLPTEQLAAPVSGILCGNGNFANVVEAGSAIQPDTLVELAITQLYGDARKPKSPFAVLAMRVAFMESTNWLAGRVILQRNYSRRIPMNSTAPGELMAGWNRALDGILVEAASDFRSKAIEEQRREGLGRNLSRK